MIKLLETNGVLFAALLMLAAQAGPMACADDDSGDGSDGGTDGDTDGDTDSDTDGDTDSDTDGCGDPITHLISSLTTTAAFFEWESVASPGLMIKYFVVMGSDGNPHAAFDACDVCYEEKKGYEQNGDLMHCKNCLNEYPINGIGTENDGYGCWPGYLPVEIADTEVIIQCEDLEDGAWYFE
jgi:hypothetical protein